MHAKRAGYIRTGDGYVSGPPLHTYVPHPNPPQRSIDLGQIKCFKCGMYKDSPLHMVIIRAKPRVVATKP